MTNLPLLLPSLQNWSCHNCGGCCRQHAIEVTPAEKLRIEEQGWEKEPGFQQGEKIFERQGGGLWNKRYRLAHRADGACVFLDDRGLCRIHAKFGEPAKPLACRVYPYAFHPVGGKIAISLRYSCPSVAGNLGKKLSENRAEIQELQRLVVPENADRGPPPQLTRTEAVSWPDLLQFVRALEGTFAREDLPLRVRLLQGLIWVSLVDQSRFDKIQGGRIAEYVQLVMNAALDEALELISRPLEPVSSVGQVPFRQLVAQYARRDTAVEMRKGWSGRWKLFQGAIAFARGTGLTPALQPGLDAVPFEEIENWEHQELAPGAEELMTRYLRVKIHSMHFCGPAYYGYPLTDGFFAQVMILPVMIWIARWLALSEGRRVWTLKDLERAMTIADHHHGYSPIFGAWGFRQRMSLFAKTGDLIRIPICYLT